MDGGRMWRGTAIAVLCTVLTAVAHVAGGGALPDLAVLLVLLPLLATVFVSTAGACRTTLGTVATLAAGQFALHGAMTLLHPGHDTGSPALGPYGMVTMHAAVTLVTAAALRHADVAVSALASGLARILPRRLTPPPARRPLRVCAIPAAGIPARLALVMAATALRRGPPVGC